MAKIVADYRDYARETIKASDEGRVLFVRHGKEGPS
jgi:hypothetical protein